MEDQNFHSAGTSIGTATSSLDHAGYVSTMNLRQVYRLRAPASGREAMAPVEPGAVYVDRESGEEMRPVTRTLPLAPSESALLRTPENLRICRRCEQLIGLDVSDCAYCGLRQAALDGGS
jgi:hypothetical protein